MSGWSDFFLGELGAAAALTGLLFVAVSVNQDKILALGRMADRGLEALAMLFLILIIASLGLVPDQPPRLFGIETAAPALIMLGTSLPLQRGYLQGLDPAYRPRSMSMVRGNRFAIALIAAAGLLLAWRGDAIGLFLLVPGILLTFVAAGANAWVLLVEINR